MAKDCEEKLCGLMQGDFQDILIFLSAKECLIVFNFFQRKEEKEYTHVSGHLTIKKQREDKTQNNDCLPVGYSDQEDNGTPLQYSCLENPMDRGAWQAAVHGVAKSWTRLSNFTFIFHFHALEKEMATHSSVLSWRIPGTGSLVGCCL